MRIKAGSAMCRVARRDCCSRERRGDGRGSVGRLQCLRLVIVEMCLEGGKTKPGLRFTLGSLIRRLRKEGE